MDIDFSQLVSDNESDGGLSLINEDELLQIEEVDIYQYEGLPSELHLDELSDLSDSEEFRDEIIEEPEQSGMSAGLRQFALCLTTLQRPFQASNKMDPSAAEEDEFDDEPQELNFNDGDLITLDPPSAADAPENPLRTDSPADMPPVVAPLTNDPPADIPAAAAPLTSVRTEDNSAVMIMDEDTLAKMFEGLPPPLEATLERYRKRQVTPEMKAHVMSIRAKKIHLGSDDHKLYLPFNLRDKIIALRHKKLAEGPLANRQQLIQEYWLKKIREGWNL